MQEFARKRPTAMTKRGMIQSDLARAAFGTSGNSASPRRARPAEPPSRLARRRLEGQAPAPRLHHRCRLLLVRHGLQEGLPEVGVDEQSRGAAERGANFKETCTAVSQSRSLNIDGRLRPALRECLAGYGDDQGRAALRPTRTSDGAVGPRGRTAGSAKARGSRGTTGRQDLPPVSQPSGSAVDRPRHATVCRPTTGPGLTPQCSRPRRSINPGRSATCWPVRSRSRRRPSTGRGWPNTDPRS
jgi:hypothetical protein